MARFFDKTELILIILLILLFDLNGFCDIALKHITYKEKTNHILLLLTISFLVIDVLIYHMILHSRPVVEVEFTVDSTLHHGKEESKSDFCIKEIKHEVEEYQKKIDNTKKICDIPTTTKYSRISELIVGNFIVVVLIFIVFGALLTTNKYYEEDSSREPVNSAGVKLLLSIPVILAALGIGIFINLPQLHDYDF